MASPLSRTQTPGRSPPPDALPAVVENGNNTERPREGPRRTSLGFLRRSKSTEPLTERKSSGGRSRKAREAAAREEELRRQREAIPKQPPRLPDLTKPPEMQTFGGDNARPDSIAIISGRVGNGRASYEPGYYQGKGAEAPPVPKVPDYDPYARTESMTHRGRYSYASSAVSSVNSPRRVRRRKDPTPYNVLVIGARNSGKTSFINFLRSSLALPPNKRPTRSPEELADMIDTSSPANTNFASYYLETEIDGERIGLTIWDSPGLEKNVVDLQLREMNAFLESKFEDTFNEEMKVVRAPGIRDTHIHCTFLILDPVRLDSNIATSERSISNGIANGKITDAARILGGLDEDLDIQVLRLLQGKTTVVPVISKADTITTVHMAYLKKTVWDSLKKAGIEPLEALIAEDDASSYDERLDERDEESQDGSKDGEEPATPTSPTVDANKNLSPPPSSKKRHSRRISSSSSSLKSAITSASTDSSYLPFSILSPDPHSLSSTHDGPVGRKFPWGFADPYNLEHCDFVRLKESVFSEWRADLREASREMWYERWRTSRLNRVSGNGAGNARSGAVGRRFP